MMKSLLIALAITPLLIAPTYAKCRSIGPLCQPGTGCEPKCITTSDGGPGRENMYTRDKKSSQGFKRVRGSWASRQGKQWNANAQAEGRAAWRNNGTPSSVGMISPFVPGSVQDKAWRAERAKRGIQ